MSSEQIPNDLIARLSRLERQNARLRGAFVMSVFAVAVCFAAGAKAPDAAKTVEAQKFVVVDAAGKRLAELGPKEDGEGVNLILRDSKGERRLLLVANDTDAGVSLVENGAVRGALTASVDKHVLLVLNRDGFKEQKNQIAAGFTDDGSPMFIINDGEGKTITKLP